MSKWFKGMGLILVAALTIVTAPIWLLYVFPVMVCEAFDAARELRRLQADMGASMKKGSSDE